MEECHAFADGDFALAKIYERGCYLIESLLILNVMLSAVACEHDLQLIFNFLIEDGRTGPQAIHFNNSLPFVVQFLSEKLLVRAGWLWVIKHRLGMHCSNTLK